MTTIELREWGRSRSLSISSDRIGEVEERLKGLARLEYDRDGVHFKALQCVGYIPIIDDLVAVVAPKIDDVDDLFYMLERSKQVEPKSRLREVTVFTETGKSDWERVPSFIVTMLLDKLRLLKRDGFYRAPIAREETRTSVRGRIDVTTTIRTCACRGRPHQVHCSYVDTTLDTAENRFIKRTLWYLRATPGLPRLTYKDIGDLWRVFSGVALDRSNRDQGTIERIVQRRQVPSSRSYYIDILSLCLLIMQNLTVIVKEGDAVRLCAFTIKMDTLFETYIRNVLTDALGSGLTVINGNKDKIKLFSDNDDPKITPDIMVRGRTNKWLLAADTKYKETSLPSAEDWYQVATYTLAMDVPVGLIICAAREPKPAKEFHTGNKSLWVYYYPLSKPKQHEQNFVNFVRQRVHDVVAMGQLATS